MKLKLSKFKETILEVVYGVLPILVIITLLQFTIAQISWELYFDFLGSTVLLVLGLALFLLGVNIGFVPVGKALGSSLVKSGSMRIILIFGFIIGFAVTVPEPDVQALALQVQNVSSNINKNTFVLIIAIGVGLFVALALLRIFLNIPIKYFLIGGYLLVFILLIFCPPEFSRMAFDAGGVTTGSLTVPFIMSLGVGVASVTAKKSSTANSFGILAIASLGPVLTVLLMGVLSR